MYAHFELRWSQSLTVKAPLHLDDQTIIACTMLALWQAHWRFVFDAQPFWPNAVAARATILIRRVHRENSF